MNLKTEREIIPKLNFDFELAHRFKHRGCDESAYPVTIINDETIVWECLIHGFIQHREVEWRN